MFQTFAFLSGACEISCLDPVVAVVVVRVVVERGIEFSVSPTGGLFLYYTYTSSIPVYFSILKRRM